MTKTAENHTLWGRTYLNSPYKEVSSLPRAYNESPYCESNVEDIQIEDMMVKTD